MPSHLNPGIPRLLPVGTWAVAWRARSKSQPGDGFFLPPPAAKFRDALGRKVHVTACHGCHHRRPALEKPPWPKGNVDAGCAENLGTAEVEGPAGEPVPSLKFFGFFAMSSTSSLTGLPLEVGFDDQHHRVGGNRATIVAGPTYTGGPSPVRGDRALLFPARNKVIRPAAPGGLPLFRWYHLPGLDHPRSPAGPLLWSGNRQRRADQVTGAPCREGQMSVMGFVGMPALW